MLFKNENNLSNLIIQDKLSKIYFTRKRIYTIYKTTRQAIFELPAIFACFKNLQLQTFE